jgi:TonB family protein
MWASSLDLYGKFNSRSEGKKMPLNVRRFSTFSVLGVLLVLVSSVLSSQAQVVTQTPQQTPPQPPPQQQSVPQTPPPTSGDIMRERISKSKAFIAVRNYNAAIYELENIRRETADPTVQGVVNVLLMNSYLEQGDYKRAQDLLNEFYNQQKTTRANAAASYMAVAGQVIKGARSRAERYRALGLSVADRTLPLEALNDLEKMRETLELVITQSKEIGKTPARGADAMMLLEEASNSRTMLARDDYDSRHWKDEVADTREEMANSRSVVFSAVNDTAVPDGAGQSQQATNTGGVQTPPVTQPVGSSGSANSVRDREVKPPETKAADTTVAKNTQPVYVPSAPATNPEPKPTETPKTDTTSKDGSPIDVGSLVAYATKQQAPTYPPAAKSMRATGIVRVDVTIDEAGDVTEVQKTSGPTLLQGAAKEAIKKWKFKPFVRDGQPVRATGFVSFNFAL